MELFNRIIEILEWNLIYTLIPAILTLFLIELFFKNRYQTKKVLNLICWLIIIYAILTWIYTFINIAIHPGELEFREMGEYNLEYWILFLSPLVLPFTLLIRKLASNFSYVLFVAFFIKIGFYFERYALIATSFLWDYMTENGNPEYTNSILLGIGLLFLQGITIAILPLGIFEIMKKRRVWQISK